MEQSLVELKQTFASGVTRNVSWRKEQIRGIHKLIEEKEDAIFQALQSDLGKHPIEAYRDEVGVVKKSANHTLNCIDKWVEPKKAPIPLLFFPSTGYVIPEPLGQVLIFSSWNFPISLALDPIIGAISAGNTVVLKPSDVAPACSALLAETIPLYLDPRAVKVIEGGVDVAEELLERKWDKIFFTEKMIEAGLRRLGDAVDTTNLDFYVSRKMNGMWTHNWSARVGRIIMAAAAKHLTPVTLELGGKCPLIVDSFSDPSVVKLTAKRLAGGKWGDCNGQACIAVDYVLVEHDFAPILIEEIKKTISNFYGDGLKNMKNVTRVVNIHHLNRLRDMLEEPSVAASIVHGGSIDETSLMIEPTILLNPPVNAAIMTEEIFGPLLPIITVSNIEESIEFINSRPKPLAIYAFTKNEALKKKILAETSSGSVTFNDILLQFLCDSLPFGGVGQSGFGSYHGKYSFDTFSHDKAVLHRSFFLELESRYPPWNDFKMNFLKLAYNFSYIRLFVLLLGWKLKEMFT